MEPRPRLQIEPDRFDRLLYLLAHGGVLVLFLLSLLYFPRLPDTIPIHFDGAGNPDGYGSKWTIWLLPFIGAGLHGLLFAIRKIPHQFNYTVPITEANAEAQYRNGIRLLALLDVVVLILFVYLQWGTIQTALGNAGGLGPFTIFLVMGSIFGVILYFLVRANKIS